ncbi:solute carrier family 22 member 15-like [Dermacentor silvarum]|uniref:solute carrier family 22 member 15-like n=1 Tax=Dermacentor silvarum TaxID=543639 RepID=UPI002100BA88|nr:solute carrier family 22 member 15-like [Dermacentor silvarum]
MHALMFACSITFYGLALDTGAVSLGGTWTTFVIASVAPLAAYFLIVRCGRRAVLAVTLAVTGACCLLAAVLHQGSTVHWQALSWAWFFINVAYSVLFIYATEIYPTTIRALGFNLGAAFGRIGTVIAPLIHGNLGRTYVLLFVVCGVSAFLVTKLPETKATHLPEKIKPEQNIFECVAFTELRA